MNSSTLANELPSDEQCYFENRRTDSKSALQHMKLSNLLHDFQDSDRTKINRPSRDQI
ncbi:hypothetical protein C0J52_00823 [Blattella germanica]|nr:hypothetical protein C0J52_15815 [Blattella germanica]PSN48790.1 hypothetical protein C0J52_07036 [Blattella germanica]PSN58453.1 hypothetical protein C0J52_00823 [Blattella germanica]